MLVLKHSTDFRSADVAVRVFYAVKESFRLLYSDYFQVYSPRYIHEVCSRLLALDLDLLADGRNVLFGLGQTQQAFDRCLTESFQFSFWVPFL